MSDMLPRTQPVKAVLKAFERGGHYPDSPAPHTNWHDVDAMADEILRLRATLAQRREGVTEAMVEAACVAMFQWWTLSTTTHADRELARIDMHDALTAALGARDGGTD